MSRSWPQVMGLAFGLAVVLVFGAQTRKGPSSKGNTKETKNSLLRSTLAGLQTRCNKPKMATGELRRGSVSHLRRAKLWGKTRTKPFDGSRKLLERAIPMLNTISP
jgi:hypothetical protein